MAQEKAKVKVYWVNSGSGTVGSDYAVSFTATRVGFADGGWNPLSESFLTESQARKSARLAEVQPKVRKAAERAAKLIIKAAELLEEGLDQ